jgi:cytochrome c biogenesis protein
VLGAAIAVLVGLLGMLLLHRQRVFARVAPATGGAPESGGTVLSIGSLTRGSGDSAARFAALESELRTALEARAPDRTAPSPDGPAPGPEVPPRA